MVLPPLTFALGQNEKRLLQILITFYPHEIPDAADKHTGIMVVPMDKLRAGMEVAADVNNLNGVLMVARGTVLTERHLRILKMWGIESIEIAGGEDGPPPDRTESEYPTELLRVAESRVDQRLKHVVVNNKTLAKIRHLAILRTARLLAEQSHPSSTLPVNL